MSSATINDFLQAITASDSSKEELKEIYSSLQSHEKSDIFDITISKIRLIM